MLMLWDCILSLSELFDDKRFSFMGTWDKFGGEHDGIGGDVFLFLFFC